MTRRRSPLIRWLNVACVVVALAASKDGGCQADSGDPSTPPPAADCQQAEPGTEGCS